MLQLRDYQADLKSDISARFRGGARSVLAVLPTGGGKTVILSEMSREAISRRLRVLILAHRRELVSQAAATLRKFGLPVGAVMARMQLEPDRPVQVASIQSITRRETRVPADLVIIDEAHHAVAAQYLALLDLYPGAWIVGFTATPQRGDGTALGDVFDEMVTGPSISELTDMGFLVPAKLYGPDAPGSLLAADPADAWIKYAMLAGFVFAKSIEASKDIVRRLRQAGIGAAHVDASTHHRRRSLSISQFREGKVKVLSSVNVFTEGVDLPMADTILLAGPCGQVSGYLQRVGRGLRTHPGKDHARIVDLLGVWHEHGLPDDEREWTLEGRGLVELNNGPAKRRCPKCLVVTRPRADRTCAACGYRPPEEAVNVVQEAELKLITHSIGHTADMKRARWRELQEMQVRNCYRPEFALERFQWQYGHRPEQI